MFLGKYKPMWFQYNLLQCRQSYSLLLTFSIKTLWRSDLSVINSGLVSVTSYNSTCRIKEIYFNCLSRLYWKDQNFYDVLVSLRVLKNPNHVVSMKKKMEIEVDCNAMTWLWCIICHNSYREESKWLRDFWLLCLLVNPFACLLLLF